MSETSKQRWNRIELDYYKTRGASGWWRSGSAMLVLVAAACWLILAPHWDSTGAAPSRMFQPERLASPGPLARPHATWESRCDACHTPFTPINGSRWSPISAAQGRSSDAKCQACHPGEAHHSRQLEAEVHACSACHRDHRGPDSPLTRVDDATCTRCHTRLDDHSDRRGDRTISAAVSRFDRDHPEFDWVRPDAGGSPRRDPGRLSFSHRLHLSPGLRREPGGVLMRYSDLNERDRGRYGWKSGVPLDAGVDLDCTACHRLQPGDSARSPGDLMLPVTFEADCRSCHPLPFDPDLPGEEVRHGIPLGRVVGELRTLYQARATRHDPDLLAMAVPRAAIPGNPRGAKGTRVDRAIEEKVTAAIRMLLPYGGKEGKDGGGCTKCHHLKSRAAGAVPGRLADAESLELETTGVPVVWYPGAKFDHSAHRPLRCNVCHENAESSGEGADVLLPGIKTCLECHSAPSSNAAGGAGFDCTECHRYHAVDRPPQGPGVPARTPPQESLKTIREFLDLGGPGRPMSGPARSPLDPD